MNKRLLLYLNKRINGIYGNAQTAQSSSKGIPLRAGTYEISIGTPFVKLQPKSVQAKIGDNVSNLTGPYIENDSGIGNTTNLYKTININFN